MGANVCMETVTDAEFKQNLITQILCLRDEIRHSGLCTFNIGVSAGDYDDYNRCNIDTLLLTMRNHEKLWEKVQVGL